MRKLIAALTIIAIALVGMVTTGIAAEATMKYVTANESNPATWQKTLDINTHDIPELTAQVRVIEYRAKKGELNLLPAEQIFAPFVVNMNYSFEKGIHINESETATYRPIMYLVRYEPFINTTYLTVDGVGDFPAAIKEELVFPETLLA